MSQEKQITRQSKSSFYYAFSILPREKREAIYTVYSFCRQTDDIVDKPGPQIQKLKTLERWENELFKQFNRQSHTRFFKLWKIAERFRIPLEYFLELIQGMRMDLAGTRFQSLDDLLTYCYRVASVVGLMSIQIFGYRDPRVREYAVNLGIALQLTNILRDVGTDAEMGRVYIPLEDLEKFGITVEDILNKRNHPNFIELMKYEYRLARQYYDKASRSLPNTERRNMLPSQIMKNIYFHLLKLIEKNHFNVLYHKIELPTFVKLSIAFKTVLRESILSL